MPKESTESKHDRVSTILISRQNHLSIWFKTIKIFTTDMRSEGPEIHTKHSLKQLITMD